MVLVQDTAQFTLAGKAMKFNITLDRDENGVENGAWVAECPSIPGCVSQGQTKAEAEENINGAIQTCLEVRADLGLPLAAC